MDFATAEVDLDLWVEIEDTIRLAARAHRREWWSSREGDHLMASHHRKESGRYGLFDLEASGLSEETESISEPPSESVSGRKRTWTSWNPGELYVTTPSTDNLETRITDLRRPQALIPTTISGGSVHKPPTPGLRKQASRCHACRGRLKGHLIYCANFLNGTCNKSFCRSCFKNDPSIDSNILCIHCRGCCPPSAFCTPHMNAHEPRFAEYWTSPAQNLNEAAARPWERTHL